jgi:hypothetical protein
MKYGNLNFLEPSGPLQACNRTDLPLFVASKIDFLAVANSARKYSRGP